MAIRFTHLDLLRDKAERRLKLLAEIAHEAKQPIDEPLLARLVARQQQIDHEWSRYNTMMSAIYQWRRAGVLEAELPPEPDTPTVAPLSWVECKTVTDVLYPCALH